ncbi:MAG: class I SAM-dependent methyltransferase, partial [Desulfomonilaceae bacterium]
MNWRIAFSWFLFRLAGWIQSLPVFLMRPRDLIAFTRSSYARSNLVEGWSRPQFVENGPDDNEVHLLKIMPVQTGRLLLLGVGGGREAIPLAQKGFDVTAVDFVPEMVAQAKENARRHNVDIAGLVQDISQLEVSRASFDV